ncbi:MAG: YifB family Mg chelatase-like AAA ATPase [Lachnospiraceae bacterium]|nr:YifB family Mg chelatase-like AAA ATPase [Lachnospiraceae bacterium]
MYSKVLSGSLEGLEAQMIQVEADVSNGLPVFDMVGYLASEVKEARERVRAAIKNQGYLLPAKRITINLAPANIRKSGSVYDLPVAMSIMLAVGWCKNLPEPVLFLGELGLNGSLRKVEGVLPMVLGAREDGIRVCVVPADNWREASMASDMFCISGEDLNEVLNVIDQWDAMDEKEVFLKNRMGFEEEREKKRRERLYKDGGLVEGKGVEADFSEIRGQFVPRRAIEIAVSGHHNLLMVGPPGSGKTALASRIPSIMPTLTEEESLELTKIYSVRGQYDQAEAVIKKRPFRAPHHTISAAAMIGGGTGAKPGEVSLAHKGVLFLDEFPEYARHVLELLRQPLEEGKIMISRNRRSCIYPADFMLVGAMNPCPCGYYPDRRRCFCTENQVRRYQSKISGPLLDRIDLMVRVNPITFEQMQTDKPGESSEAIRKRATQARKIQQERYKDENYHTNSKLNRRGLEKYCSLTQESVKWLDDFFAHHEISARGYERILRIARTIADMDGEEKIEQNHVAEAAAFKLGFGEGDFH